MLFEIETEEGYRIFITVFEKTKHRSSILVNNILLENNKQQQCRTKVCQHTIMQQGIEESTERSEHGKIQSNSSQV